MNFLINLIIWILVLGILFKIVELALKIFGVGITPEIKQLIGLLFLLFLLVQIFGLAGLGIPHYTFYPYKD